MDAYQNLVAIVKSIPHKTQTRISSAEYFLNGIMTPNIAQLS